MSDDQLLQTSEHGSRESSISLAERPLQMSVKAQTILFVSQAANLYGSERTLLTLLEGELPPGMKPLVVCPKTGPLCDALEKLGVELIPWVFNASTFRNNPLSHWRFVRDFCKLLKQRRPKAVVVVYEGNVPLLVIACRLCGVPVYRILQREVRPQPNKRGGGNLMDRLAFKGCDGVFCGAATLEKQLGEVYKMGAHPPVALVRLPVRTVTPDMTDTLAWRQRYGIPAEAALIGQFGRIHPVKGIDVLIRAAKQVNEAMPEVHYVVCGGADGSSDSNDYLTKMQALAADLGLQDRIHFTGAIADVFTGMSACDIVALCSRAEGVGIACLEALLCERPVVGSDVDGLGEIIRESGGGLATPVGDHAKIAADILLLLAEPSRRSELGRLGRNWVVQNCAPEIFRKDFWSAFNQFEGHKK